MRRNRLAFRFILLFVFNTLAIVSMAANRFWIAAASSNWNNTANWSASSGGPGGASVPVAADQAFFNNLGVGDCAIDVNINVGSITVSGAYTGTILQGGNNVNITGALSFAGGIFNGGSGTFGVTGASTFSGGTFTGGSGNITLIGALTISGTAFTSTSATLEFRNNTAFTGGSFAHNNGLTRYNGTGVGTPTISGVSPAFYDLEFVGLAKTYAISSTGNITVSNNLSITGTQYCLLNTGTIDVAADVNITNSATGGGGSALININGTGNQNISGSTAAGLGTLPRLTINKSGGSLNLANFISVGNNFSYVTGTVNAGTSTVCFVRSSVATIAITGSISLNDIEFLAVSNTLTCTIAAGSVITAVGNLYIDGTRNITLNTGTINAQGDIVLTNTGNAGGGTTTIAITGSGNQNIDGTAITGNQSRLPIVNINKSGGTLSFAGNISFAANLTYTAGTINAGSSVVFLVNNLTINGSFSLNDISVGGSAAITITIAAGNTVTASGDLSVTGTFNVTLNTGTVAVAGDILDANSATGGGGTATILINGTATQTISSTGIIDQGRLPAVTINKSSGTLVFPSLITVRGNWTYVAGTLDVATNNSTVVFSNSPTISGSHTLQNIQFSGTAANTITITAATILRADGNMLITGGSNVTINTGKIELMGDLNLTNTATGGGGTATIYFISAVNQTINSSLPMFQSNLPGVLINKASGTLIFPAIITVKGSWTYSAGTLDVTTNNSTVVFNNTQTISGTHNLNNVTFQASASYTYTITTGTVLGVDGVLTTAGASSITISTPVSGSSVLEARGDIAVNNTNAGGGGTAAILINGTGTQNFNSSAAAGQGRLPFIRIQKTSGTLNLSGNISESRDWTYLSGTVSAGTSTVIFGGNNLSITSNGMSFNNATISANTSTLTNNFTVAGNLTISGTAVLAAGANTIDLGGNWTNYATGGFTEATSTVNFTGSALQTITCPGAGGENFANAGINNAAGIQLANNLTVSGTLSMVQGNANLNGNMFTLGISTAVKGSLTRTAGMFYGGTFRRWFSATTIGAGSNAGLFPNGNGTDYRPISVFAPTTAPTTGGTIQLAYSDAATTSNSSFSDGAFVVMRRHDAFWQLTTGGTLAGGTYELIGEGTGFGQVGNVNDLRLTRVNNVTGTAGTNGGTTANPQIQRTGISFANLTNAFYVGSIDILNSFLPATLISFDVIPSSDKILLNWSTATEINNDYFTVQRSADAITWENLLKIDGAGNSLNILNYTATDTHPIEGISYYRLRQTDFDGKQTYSVVRTVNHKPTVSKIQVYPNPVADQLTVQLPADKRMRIDLMNASGQVLYSVNNYNRNRLLINVTPFPAGNYFLKVTDGTITETHQVVIGK